MVWGPRPSPSAAQTTEATPNPNTMKFLPGQPVLGDKTAFFTDADNAKASPLASALFVLSDIRAVFFGGDFITVTKTEAANWDVLKPQILTTVMEHYQNGLPLMSAGMHTFSNALNSGSRW